MKGPIFQLVPNKLFLSGTWQKFDEGRARMELDSRRITHVINLGKSDPRWLERPHVMYEYHHVPDSKLSVPSEYVGKIADRMVEVIHGGGCVLSMCYGGRNRSALLAGLIMHRLDWRYGSDIVDHILKVRPAALINEGYRQHLLSLAKKG